MCFTVVPLHFVVVVQVIPGAKSSVAEEVTPNDTLCHTCQFLKLHCESQKKGELRQLSTDQRKINLQLYVNIEKWMLFGPFASVVRDLQYKGGSK